MKRLVKPAAVLLILAGVGVFGAWRFMGMPPRMSFTVRGGGYEELVIHPVSGEPLPIPLHEGTCGFPISHGKWVYELKGGDRPSLWLFYFHTDAGLRRLVDVNIDTEQDGTGAFVLKYNGFRIKSARFTVAEHAAADQSLDLQNP